MIDIKQDLVTLLENATSLPVYYELFYKPGELPAITYKEIDNASLYEGDTLDYSTLRYEIKVWSRSLPDLITAVTALDLAMRDAGWSRYYSFETNDGNNTIIKVIRYVATGYSEV